MGILKSNLLNKYVKAWQSELDEIRAKGDKLEFYSLLKNKFEQSDYLNICTNPKSIMSITRMRISAHKLPIETGRFIKLERNQRICPFCCSGVGDEQHYLTTCDNNLFVIPRKECFDNISKIHTQFQGYSDAQKAIFLLNTKDPVILKNTGHFVLEIENIFKDSRPVL